MNINKKENKVNSEVKFIKAYLIRNNKNDNSSKDCNKNKNEEYQIEQILAKRFIGRNRKIEYFIKWQGYDMKNVLGKH